MWSYRLWEERLRTPGRGGGRGQAGRGTRAGDKSRDGGDGREEEA